MPGRYHANPLDDARLQEKCEALAGPVLSERGAREVAEMIWRFEQLDDVAQLAVRLQVEAASQRR